MTFLTAEMKDKLSKLDVKELDKIVKFIDRIKHQRKFSIMETHGKPLINAHHFSKSEQTIKESEKKAAEKSASPPKKKEENPFELLRRLSMPDEISDSSSEKKKTGEHVFSTKAEVEWYYIVEGEDVVYPEEFCDVLEGLFRKPGHTGRHQKQTPFVDGDDTCIVDLHLMRHTNQRTGKIYPLRRKKNPLYAPKKPDPSESGGASLPSENENAAPAGPSMLTRTATLAGVAAMSAFGAAKSVSEHPKTATIGASAVSGAKQGAQVLGGMFTRTMTWLGGKQESVKKEEESRSMTIEQLSKDLPENGGGAEMKEAEEEEEIKEPEVIVDASAETPAAPRKRGEPVKLEKREPEKSPEAKKTEDKKEEAEAKKIEEKKEEAKQKQREELKKQASVADILLNPMMDLEGDLRNAPVENID